MSEKDVRIAVLEGALMVIMDHAYSNEATYRSLRLLINRQAGVALGREKINAFREILRDRINTRSDATYRQGTVRCSIEEL